MASSFGCSLTTGRHMFIIFKLTMEDKRARIESKTKDNV